MAAYDVREKFPNFFKVRNLGVGFGEGWISIINNLFLKMTQEVTQGAAQPDILQIKEKLGGLRVYIAGGSDKIYKLINEAEHLSFSTCEVCGETGVMCSSEHGWLKVLCAKHMEETNCKRVD